MIIKCISRLLFTCTLLSHLSVFAFIDNNYSLNGINFHVQSENNSSINQLTITATGLANGQQSITEEIDGLISNIEVADLNHDGSPEIYVFIRSAGSGSYGSVVAYSSNNNKSISPIYLAPFNVNEKNAKGYMGHDEFSIVNAQLIRRFPLYQKGDTNHSPTGGTRQLVYILTKGEASWQLTLDKSSHFNHQ